MNKIYNTYPGLVKITTQLPILRNFYHLSILASFISIPALFLPWLRIKFDGNMQIFNGMGVLNDQLQEIFQAPQESFIFPLLIIGSMLVGGVGLAFRSNFFFLPLSILSGLELGFLVWKLNNPAVGCVTLFNVPFFTFQPEIGFPIAACCAASTFILAISGIIYQAFLNKNNNF